MSKRFRRTERYEVKNIDELKQLELKDIIDFNMKMLGKEMDLGTLCGFNMDGEGSVTRSGGNVDVEMLIIKKNLGLDMDDKLTPDAEAILNQLKSIEVCDGLDKYNYAINNLKNLGNKGTVDVTVKPNQKSTSSQPSNDESSQPSNDESSQPSNDESSGLSGGAIAGIIIGILVLVIGIVTIVIFAKKKSTQSVKNSLGQKYDSKVEQEL